MFSRLVWSLTIAAIVGTLLFDFVFHVRKAHVEDVGGGGSLVVALSLLKQLVNRGRIADVPDGTGEAVLPLDGRWLPRRD
jgi:hypothetical protein